MREQMTREELLRRAWEAEEAVAHIHGWDFSHIEGRYSCEDDLPWDYRAIVRSFLRPDARLLDYDTGGGEFLLKLKRKVLFLNFSLNLSHCI